MSPKPDQEWREEFTGAMDKYQPGSEAERKLLRKIDMRIVPTVWLVSRLPQSSSLRSLTAILAIRHVVP